ncbi:MAG: HAMP domain-containing protein [Calditrichaeota bacterium]|nr:MAG: HAMP domain-containing protein [Calditrichota bacterium]
MENLRPKNRLQYKITIYIVLLVVLIINSVGWFLYFSANHYLDEELGKKLISIAQFAAGSIEPDLLDYLQPGDEAGEFYGAVQKNLQNLQHDFNLKRSYIIDSEFKMIVDSQGQTSISAPVLYLQSHILELNATLNGQSRFSVLYRGSDGIYYKSAFAPLKTRDGIVSAICCVDASPEFLQVLDNIKNSILFINTISLFFAIFISFFLAKSIVNPITKLVAASEKMSQGDLSRAVKIKSRDEIGYLGIVFNSMQENIRTQQEKLQELRFVAEAKADSIQSYNDYILQSITNGILTIDLQGRITVFNPETEKILNLNHANKTGKKWQDIITELHPFNKILSRLLEKKEALSYMENQLHFRDSSKTVGIQFSHLLTANDEKIGYNIVLTDLTVVKNLQNQIIEKERLAYLGELSAAVAHEIRNPLNSIELYMGLLKRQLKEDSTPDENIDKIQSEIKSLNAIVTNFLKFARQPELELRRVLISDILQEALFLATGALKEKNIAVRMNLGKDKLALSADFGQLKQAMLNIILNAIQAMNDNGKLTLSALEFTNEKVLGIEITDTGSGIAASHREKIFNPFFSTRSQGTGLGLSIVKNIIEAHHGTIFVESRINKGTRITVKLPMEHA